MYKFRLVSTSFLSRDIQKKALEIAKSRVNIAKLTEKLRPSFEKLRKANVELSKLSVSKVKLREQHPQLKDMYAEKRKLVKEITSDLSFDITNILKEIESITDDLKKIIFDADTILYRESKALDKFRKEINKLSDKKLAAKISSDLMLVKEDIKTTARRLYELAKSPDMLNKPFSKKLDIAKHVINLSKDVALLNDTLGRLKLSNIDEITKEAEKELSDIRKIELAIISLIPELRMNIAVLRSKLYLLESSAAGRLSDKFDSAEKKIFSTLKKISEQAEDLFEEIVIVKKI